MGEHNEDMEDLVKVDGQPDVESQVIEPGSTIDGTGSVESSNKEGGEQNPDIPDIKIDGKRYTPDEIRAGMMKDRDYRRKTAELAEKRRFYESEIERLQSEVESAQSNNDKKQAGSLEVEVSCLKKDVEKLRQEQQERILEENRAELVEHFGEEALSDWEEITLMARVHPGLRAWQIYLIRHPELVERRAVERLKKELEEKKAVISDGNHHLRGNLKETHPKTLDEAVDRALRDITTT